MQTEIKNLGELKTFLSTLSEDQLKQPFRWWGDSVGGNSGDPDDNDGQEFDSVVILEEDHINPSGESCEPVSVYLNDPDYGEDFVDGEEVVRRRGEIVFQIKY